MMPTIPAKLDLAQAGLLAEIIIRGGDLTDTQNNQRTILQANYRQVGQEYTVHGLSVFVSNDPAHPKTYQMLAAANRVFNKRLSISVVDAVKNALERAGYGMIFYVTPFLICPIITIWSFAPSMPLERRPAVTWMSWRMRLPMQSSGQSCRWSSIPLPHNAPEEDSVPLQGKEDAMVTFIVDFNRMISDPARGLTQAVPLGYESLNPALDDLQEGQRLIVDMPGELWAEAQATHRDDERGRYWYGELVGPVHYYDEEGAPVHHAS
jgi:hypothetical protein